MNSEFPDVARRITKAGCAPLLALPAALSCNAPALAQTVIGTSQNTALSLDGLAGPVEIASGVSITSTGAVAVSASLPAQLVNAGQVQDSAGIGISLGGGKKTRQALVEVPGRADEQDPHSNRCIWPTAQVDHHARPAR